MKKQFAPYLKQVIGSWLCCQFDIYKEVSSIAVESFWNAFPEGKRVDVLVFCQSEVLAFITENVLNQTPETLSELFIIILTL